MTPKLLNMLITNLHEANLNVVAFVGDNGGGNVCLWKVLGVNYLKTTMKHPVTGDDIYMFSDVPHCLKLLRNWFIDGGFKLKDETILNKFKIKEIIETNPEITPIFKQTQKLSKFIDLVNKWFDISNSYAFEATAFKKPYGLALKEQDTVLDEMYDTVKNMKCFNKSDELQNALQIFQKGILMSITSLKLLRSKMNEKFGFKFILTHRLNQDFLENFFCQIRGRSGQHDHPTPVIMLGKNPGVALHNHSNTIEMDPEEYVSAKFMNVLSEKNCKQETNRLYGIVQNQGGSDFTIDCSEWVVESLDDADASMEAIPNEFSDNSDDWPVEFLEFTAIEIERLENLSFEYCFDDLTHDHNYCDEELTQDPIKCNEEGSAHITDEFLADLENEMPVDKVSKRIEKTIEDGIG
ncbi:hypothetical protein HA402_005645 [Bradysia odoriphaga]|nr:hypothetical protein HA402_005645 [Bradysia odoriphaga]